VQLRYNNNFTMIYSSTSSSAARTPAIPDLLTYQSWMQFMLTYRLVMATNGFTYLAPSLHKRLIDIPREAPPGPVASDDDAQAETATQLRAAFMSLNGLKVSDSFAAHDSKALAAFMLVLQGRGARPLELRRRGRGRRGARHRRLPRRRPGGDA
jgi:hypothetical protein